MNPPAVWLSDFLGQACRRQIVAMPLILKIETLSKGPLHLRGEIAADKMQMESLDELIEVGGPLEYDLTAKRTGDNISLQGRIGMRLKCECARCLQPFEYRVELPDWSCLLLLSGEEKIELINDSADLTPYLREDTFLAFPQHPLCESWCGESPQTGVDGKPPGIKLASNKHGGASAWAELDQLNLE